MSIVDQTGYIISRELNKPGGHLKSIIIYTLSAIALLIGCCAAVVVPIAAAYLVYKVVSHYLEED